MLDRIRVFGPLLVVLVGAAAAVAAYLQALDYPFIYDDITYITDNTKLAGLNFADLWRLFTEPYNDYSEFLPLRELSYWLDMTLFGLTPSAFRMHNIILYLLCLPLVYGTTMAVWRYFRQADESSAPWAAAIVTLLFALNPSHAEAVVWISGRKDVLSGMFSLLALWLAMRARRENGLSVPNAAAALIALLAAMLSKATAVAVGPVIAMIWLMYWHDMPAAKRSRQTLLWIPASLLLAIGIALAFSVIIKSKIPFYFGMEAVARTLAVLGWLARLAISPEDRHFYYPVFEDPNLPAMIALGVAVLVAAGVGVVMILRRRTLEGFAVVVFMLLCIPSLQLIPYAPPSLVSDRFVFLSAWPAILLVVSLVWRLKQRSRTTVLLVIAAAWCFQTVERTRDWSSHEVMIEKDLRAYPGYYMPAMYKILNVQLKQGLYRDAAETAKDISDPKFRDIMRRLVEVDYATVNAASGNPQQVMALLSKLELDLGQPPVQAMWNSPVNHFYTRGREVLYIEWEDLTEHFPNEVANYHLGLWTQNGQQMKQ